MMSLRVASRSVSSCHLGVSIPFSSSVPQFLARYVESLSLQDHACNLGSITGLARTEKESWNAKHQSPNSLCQLYIICRYEVSVWGSIDSVHCTRDIEKIGFVPFMIFTHYGHPTRSKPFESRFQHPLLLSLIHDTRPSRRNSILLSPSIPNLHLRLPPLR